MTVRVVDAIADELWGAGVRRIYGIPGGGSNMELIDAAVRRGLRFVLAHQETAAIFMAAAEAELTGIPGVCVATVGPGVANSINGLAHCSLDRVPLVLITDRADDRLTLHQAVDHRLLVAAAVKRSDLLEPGSARHAVRAALRDAVASPPGPLHLDLAPSVAAAVPGDAPVRETAAPAEALDESDLGLAADALASSARPVALVGLAARSPEAVAAVRAFVERFGIPVLCTYKAKGVLPDGHRLAAGLVTNGVLEDRVLGRADALVAIGFDAVELMPGSWKWPLPTVALGAAGGPLDPTVELGGEPAAGLARLTQALETRGWAPAWNGGELPSAWLGLEEAGNGTGLGPAALAAAVRKLAPAGAIATVDAGSHMFAATLFWRAPEPRRFLISNGLATMGYGLPAAIGASVAYPDELVVCFTGDGGLAMAAGELATAARVASRLVVVVFNDATLNLIKIKQEKRGKTTEGLDFDRVDWAAVAGGLGLQAFTAHTPAELSAAFGEALDSNRPALIDVAVDASGYGDLLTLIRG